MYPPLLLLVAAAAADCFQSIIISTSYLLQVGHFTAAAAATFAVAVECLQYQNITKICCKVGGGGGALLSI